MFLENNEVKYKMKLSNTVRGSEQIIITHEDFSIISIVNEYIMKKPWIIFDN